MANSKNEVDTTLPKKHNPMRDVYVLFDKDDNIRAIFEAEKDTINFVFHMKERLEETYGTLKVFSSEIWITNKDYIRTVNDVKKEE